MVVITELPSLPDNLEDISYRSTGSKEFGPSPSSADELRLKLKNEKKQKDKKSKKIKKIK